MTMTLPLLLLILMCQILIGICSNDSTGAEFIIAYTENEKKDNYQEKKAPVYPLEMFVLPSGADPVTVNVTAPSFSSYALSHHVTVKSGASVKLEIDISLQLAGNEQSSKGIHVKASGDVVLLLVNRQKYTSDGYLALPVHVLGTEYYAVTEYPDDNCQFAIVATEDGTVVDITLSNNNNAKSVQFGQTVHNPGDTFQVTLDKFGTVQIQSDGDLTGSFISSNKPIAFLSGNRRTIVNSGVSSDHLVEQLFSVDKWGKSYNVVPVPKRTVGDYFKVVASADSTSINVTCLKDSDSYNTVVSLQKAGDFEMLLIKPGRYCSFRSNYAIMVVQFVLSQSNSNDKHDPSMILIAPEEQYLPGFIFTTPIITGGSYENFLMIVVKTSEKSGLRIDGNELPGDTSFQEIPGTDYSGCYVNVDDGYHSIIHVSPIAAFSGIIYGRAQYESYGISVGLRLGPANMPCTPTVSVDGDGIDNDCDGRTDEELCTADNNQKDDDGDGVSDEDCVLPLPVDGVWETWGEWSKCAATCSPSHRYRQRKCTDPLYGGKQCSGAGEETASCTLSPCPVHGNWDTWDAWSGCSMTCNPYHGSTLRVQGMYTRTRNCTNPAPEHGGRDCDGNRTETGYCEQDTVCPDTNGNWGVWEDWSDCLRFRFRSCDNPAPSKSGKYCVGQGNESSACSTTTQTGSPQKAPNTVTQNSVTQNAVTQNAVTQIPGTNTPCECQSSNVSTSPRPTPPTPDNMAGVLEQLNRELRRNPKGLSKYKRTLGSAPDSRTSSMLIGSLLAVIIVVIMVGFLIMDLDKLYRFVRERPDDERMVG